MGDTKSLKTISIPFALWGGSTVFRHGKKGVPWIGVAIDKIGDDDEFLLQLDCLKTKPTYHLKTAAFVDKAIENKWTQTRRGHVIAHRPLNEIEEIVIKDSN